jgi:hypothetical protein
MNNEQHLGMLFPRLIIRRPLSFATGALAVLVILTALYMRLRGYMYLGQLDYIDTFTPVMIGVLMLRGILTLRRDTDLQAVSIALIGALSFIFIYEAIYKLSFYAPPYVMPAAEFREFLIQTGIALTATAGFAFGKFRLSRPSIIFLCGFVFLYGFWFLAGYPQIDTGKNVYPVVINIPFGWNLIYTVNRGTKVLMFLAYFFFYDQSAMNKGSVPE